MFDITDLRSTIVPKSDQLNSEQLLGGPMNITVTDVRTGSGEDQPVSIHYEDDNGRPYKPCKTMRKVLILAWGHDARRWIGQSMTLFNEPSVKFGGMDVGGIRISHMTGIPKDIHVSLTATKGKKAMHTIKLLKPTQPARLQRTEAHNEKVAELETLAAAAGFDAFKAAWELLPKSDRAAIGTAERDRIGDIGRALDAQTAGA